MAYSDVKIYIYKFQLKLISVIYVLIVTHIFSLALVNNNLNTTWFDLYLCTNVLCRVLIHQINDYVVNVGETGQ